jgi:hypothetical protein
VLLIVERRRRAANREEQLATGLEHIVERISWLGDARSRSPKRSTAFRSSSLADPSPATYGTRKVTT